MKKLLVCLISALLLCVCACVAESSLSVLTADGCEVKPQLISSGTYLFLPSGTNTESVNFSAPEGCILRGSKGTVQLTSCTDLTQAVGTLTPGSVYTVSISGDGSNYQLNLLVSSGVRTMFISVDAEREWLDESKDNKAEGGSIIMTDEAGTVQQTLKLKSMKARGSASFRNAARKSYSLTLKDSAELVDGAGKTKKWAIVANDVQSSNYHDNTGIEDFTAYQLYSLMNGIYALQNESIDVYINGEYRGMYMLVEKVTIGKNAVDIAGSKVDEDKDSVTRVIGSCGLFLDGTTQWFGTQAHDDMLYLASDDIRTIEYTTAEEDAQDPAIAAGIRAYQYATNSTVTEAGGVLLNLELRFAYVNSWFVTRRGITIALDDPEYASREQVQEIAIKVQEFEDALFAVSGYNTKGLYYTDYIDNDSLITYLTCESFLSNCDTMLASSFFSCDRLEDGTLGPITFGPIWDDDFCEYDATTLTPNYRLALTKSEASGYPYRGWMLQMISRPEILSQIHDLWASELETIAVNFCSSDGALNDYISRTSVARKLTGILSADGRDYDSQVKMLTNGLKNRINAWQNVIWSRKHLTNVTVTSENGVLTATANGPINKIRWYEINDDYTETLIDTARSIHFTPDHSGKYAAVVTGEGVQGLNTDVIYSNVYEYVRK